MGLLDLFSNEAGQGRRKWLDKQNDELLEAIQYFAGPGVDVKQATGLLNMFNPVNDMGEAMADTRDGDYIGAAINTASALAPAAAWKLAGSPADDIAGAVTDTLAGFNVKAQGTMDAGRQFAGDEFGGAGPGRTGITAYHGSPHDFDRFSMDDGPSWFSDNKGYSEGLAGRSNFSKSSEGSMYQVNLKLENPLEVDVQALAKKELSEAGLDIENMSPEEIEEAWRGGQNFEFLVDQFETKMRSGDHDAIAFRGTYDGYPRETDQYVVFDENLIEIVRKYGVAGAAMMLGVTAADIEDAMNGT